MRCPIIFGPVLSASHDYTHVTDSGIASIALFLSIERYCYSIPLFLSQDCKYNILHIALQKI